MECFFSLFLLTPPPLKVIIQVLSQTSGTKFSLGEGTLISKIDANQLLKIFDLYDLSIAIKNVFNKSLDFGYFVVDQPDFNNRNQLWHFDSDRKIKILIPLESTQEGVTRFLLGSHKNIYAMLSGFLRFVSFGRIKIAQGGCQGLPFFSAFLSGFRQISFPVTGITVFDTNCVHSAGQSSAIRKVLILHFS
jgi:hypothetical protein